MGGIARQNRCERFIREFGKELVGQIPLEPGMFLRVKAVGLGMDPIDEVVKPFVTLEYRDPLDHKTDIELVIPEVMFEPESDEATTIDNTVHVLLDPEEWESYEKGEQVKGRLKKAELID